ncbi:MAG: hypothetical protein KI792_03855 [Alphaproteobacteria bacterium]|nr:hypothetical protein [Alphaproteobacteria bacterium SS10]
MSDGLSIAASTVRAFDPPNEIERPPAADIQDNAINDLAEVFFISPVAELDVDTSLVLFQFRDTATGEVTRQFPSEQTLAQRDAGIGLSPQDIANLAADAAVASVSPAQEQNAEAIEELQEGNDPPPAVEAPDAEAPTTVAAAATAAPAPAEETTAPPAAPEVVQVTSGAPSNGVSDVTNGGTDANAVGEGEIRSLATES